MIFSPALLRRCGAALAVLALSSCAKDGAEKESKVAGKSKKDQVLALTEREGGKALADRYQFQKGDIKRDENGTFVGGKRSEFDGKKNLSFGGGVGTATYKKTTYDAPVWSGNTEARTSPYAGQTDGSRFQTASRFQGTSASQTSQRSRYDGTQAATSSYKNRVGKARESTAQPLDKPTDAWTDFRRRVYPQPHIMSQSDYDRMTIEQTRSILGRDR